ncbi:MAG: hypothetical protein IJS65_05650 [Clostridia bacterium]|nr:hypothetical protein [Clostridia bacterium]
MKKLLSFTALLCALLLLCSCGAPASEENARTDEKTPETKTDISVGAVKISYAGWTEDEKIMSAALNENASLKEDGYHHYPVFKFETKEELDAFKNDLHGVLSTGAGYNEIPSFDETTAGCGDAFFAENTLLTAYVTAGSGSLRFGLRGVFADGDVLRLDIEQTNDPEVCTADMAGWLLTAEFKKSDLEGFKSFDAVFVGKAELCGMPD